MGLNNGNDIIYLGKIEDILEMGTQSIFMTGWNKLNPFLDGFWIKSDRFQYFKPMKNYTDLINDLLGEKITEFFHLPSVHNKLAEVSFQGEKIQGLLSVKEEQKQYTYQTIEKMLLENDLMITALYNIRNLSFIRAIEEEYNDFLLPNQLKTLIIRDIITNEQNRKMQDIVIKKNMEVLEISQIKNYEQEWKLSILEDREDCDDLDIIEEEIQLNYRIKGLLSVTEEEKEYIRKDNIFQENLNLFMNMDIRGLLEQVELETHLPINQKDYDYYSLYQETVKQKLKKQRFLS